MKKPRTQALKATTRERFKDRTMRRTSQHPEKAKNNGERRKRTHLWRRVSNKTRRSMLLGLGFRRNQRELTSHTSGVECQTSASPQHSQAQQKALNPWFPISIKGNLPLA